MRISKYFSKKYLKRCSRTVQSLNVIYDIQLQQIILEINIGLNSEESAYIIDTPKIRLTFPERNISNNTD